MKAFLLKVLLLVFVPGILLSFIPTVIPITWYAYRPWEALRYMNIIPLDLAFYPSQHVTMISSGDLCHHTSEAIFKKESWITDWLGFRNDEFVEKADVLLIGDSFFAGCSLDQESTLSNQLKKKNSLLKVYCMAPSSMSQFDKYIKLGKIKKPRMLIFSCVERNVPEALIRYKDNTRDKTLRKVSQYCHGVSIDLLCKKLSSAFKWIKARVKQKTGAGVPGISGSHMYFLRGIHHTHTSQQMDSTVTSIIDYKNYCDSLGIEFLFVPMPDKESVYYQNVPFPQQPSYLLRLDLLLKQAQVPTISTLYVYNEYRKKNTKLLYHLDDTHWNYNATELLSGVISSYIQNSPGITANVAATHPFSFKNSR